MAAAVDLDESIALLERTPRVLHELLAGLPESWLTERDTPSGWTARDVVGHLISAELDDWIPRAEMIVTDGTTKPFEPIDRFAHVERDRDASMHHLLDRFAELRAASIACIRESCGGARRYGSPRPASGARRGDHGRTRGDVDGPRP